jgi:hypothetical protein
MTTKQPGLNRAVVLALRILGFIAVAVALFAPASLFDESMMFFGSILAAAAFFIVAGRIENRSKSKLISGPPKSGE